MRKGHGRWVLWIAIIAVAFGCSTQAGPLGSFGSSGAGVHASAQVASPGEAIVLNGSGAGSSMLQFKAGGHLLGFQPKKVYFASLDHALSVEFLGTVGVMPKAAAEGRETGDKSKAPTLSKVVYEGLWEGISLMYEPREGGLVESTYHIAAGAEVSKIRLRYNVVAEAQRDGSLKFKFERGFLTESSPMAWQEIGGKRVPVEVEFRVSRGEVGFSVGRYDPSYPLTIDPTYAWHTFYGSGDDDYGQGIAVDGSGNVYVTGHSYATWGSPLHAYSGGYDIFVLKLNSSGTYQWHTFYGSSNVDEGRAIAVDGSGNVYVTGRSNVTWGSPLHAHSGYDDIFVLKLNSSGTYQWHTFYGSSSYDYGQGIAVDGSGNVYVTGHSYATWGSPLHAYSGGYDIFVLKLNSSGAYKWHTFYGSSGDDFGQGIAIDGSGNVYVTGVSAATWSAPGAPLHAYSGANDIFVLKLGTFSGAYQWHTFYGSSGDDQGYGIAVDGSGNVYVTGRSGYDIFVLKLNSSGSYQWQTFYGSSSYDDQGYGIAVDGSGNVYVTGVSKATWNGPVGQNPLHAHSGSFDMFVLKLNSSGTYQWHTFYGSSGDDFGNAIAVDASGNAYVTGGSNATWNGPVGQNPLDGYSGSYDIFVLKLSPTRCDFNGDGKTDILWRYSMTGDNAVWLMDGTSVSSAVHLQQVSDTGWEIVGTGDFNSDGKTDILWRYKTDGQNAVWLMDGTSVSSAVYLQQVSDTGWEIVGTGDFNNDGKTDIVWRYKTGGQNAVWLMDGTTMSSVVWLPQVSDTAWEVVGPK